MTYRPCVKDILHIGEDEVMMKVEWVEIYGSVPDNIIVHVGYC